MRCYGYNYIGYNNNVSDNSIIIQGKNMEEVKMIKYNVDEKNRAVAAYFEGGMLCWYDCLYRKARKTDHYHMLDSQIVSDIIADNLDNLNGTLYGIARASETDKWNEEIGKEVAKLRLLRKYYNIEINILKKMSKLIEAYADIAKNDIQNVIDKHTSRILDYEKSIKEK